MAKIVAKKISLITFAFNVNALSLDVMIIWVSFVVCRFQDFFVIQILREINFDKNISLQKNTKIHRNQNSEPLNTYVKKAIFENMDCLSILISRKIWKKEKSWNVHIGGSLVLISSTKNTFSKVWC